MKISSFSQQIVTVPYERNGESVTLEINIDAFTPDYFRDIGKRLNTKIDALEETGKKAKRKTSKTDPKKDVALFEAEALALEVNREIYAEFLYPGVLLAWDLTEDDDQTPVPLNKDSLMRLTPSLVQDLWRFCVEQSKTVKKPPTVETPGSQTTGGTIDDGSQALRVVGGRTT